jgi:hypothetical protein
MNCATALLLCGAALVVYCQPPGPRKFPDTDRQDRRPGNGDGRRPGPDDGPSGGPRGDGPCKIVDLATNETTERFTCPGNNTCTQLDPFNPNPNVEVYFCTGSEIPNGRPPLRQPCRVIDLATNTSTEGPAVCPPTSNCSVIEQGTGASGDPNVQNVYCTRPLRPDSPTRGPSIGAGGPGAGSAPGGRGRGNRPGGSPPPPCKVVLLATNEVLSERSCPGGTACAQLDATNTDSTVAKYQCAPPAATTTK